MNRLPTCCGREVSDIRYIKLGKRGGWENDCFKHGIIRLGFSTGEEKVLQLALNSKWDKLKRYWSQKNIVPQTVTSYVNQTKSFFEDDGSVLWITFSNKAMWYGFSNGGEPKAHPDGDGSYKKMSVLWSNERYKAKAIGHGYFKWQINQDTKLS